MTALAVGVVLTHAERRVAPRLTGVTATVLVARIRGPPPCQRNVGIGADAFPGAPRHRLARDWTPDDVTFRQGREGLHA